MWQYPGTNPLTSFKRVVTLALLAIFFAANSAAPVHAQSALDLDVNPSVWYLQVKPGETTTHTVTFKHKGTIPITVSPKIYEFTVDPDTGLPVLQGESHLEFIKPLLAEGETVAGIRLGPSTTHDFKFEISPGSSQLQREYHLTILFEVKPETFNDLDAQARVSGVIGSNLILMVSSPNPAHSGLSFGQLSSARFIDSFQAIEFHLTAQNQGIAAQVASGSAKIVDWQKKTVAEFTFKPDAVLAQTTRPLSPKLSEETQKEKNILASKKPIFRYKPTFSIGLYTIEATLLTNTNGGQTTIQQTVLALPFSVLILIIISCLVYSMSIGLFGKYRLKKP